MRQGLAADIDAMQAMIDGVWKIGRKEAFVTPELPTTALH
jgi:hypothetical protein